MANTEFLGWCDKHGFVIGTCPQLHVTGLTRYSYGCPYPCSDHTYVESIEQALELLKGKMFHQSRKLSATEAAMAESEQEKQTWGEIFREIVSPILFFTSGASMLADKFYWAIFIATWAIYLEVYDRGR